MSRSNTFSRSTAMNARSRDVASAASILALGLLLPLAGCGPAAIGAGLSGGGGGGGPAAPGPVVVSLIANELQPEDNKTLICLSLAQDRGQAGRLYFDYDLGQGPVKIPSVNLTPYSLATGTPAKAVEVDAGGNFVVTETAGQLPVCFLWDHEADIGRVEARGVTLRAVAGLADTFETSFRATDEGITPFTLFSNRTIGRELSELSELTLSREAAGNPESEVVVGCVLRDFGADREMTGFALRYAFTAQAPTEQDFTDLLPMDPTSVVDTEEPDGRLRSDLTFKFNPITQMLPLGSYPNLWISVQHSESYGPERAGVPPVVKVGTPELISLADSQIGYAPQIETASVIDPGSPQSSLGDGGKPWLKLPIAMRIYNPSPTLTIQVRVDGRYTIGADQFAITPFESGDPRSDVVFTLAPLERQRHYLVWNTVADEGLGSTPQVDTGGNPSRVANVDVTATLISAGTQTLSGGPLSSSAIAGFTTLSTSPFVSFPDNILPLARRIWSSGDQVTQKTRDLFYTNGGTVNPAQEFSLGLDQQFEPKQIVPAPPVFEFSESNGIYDIVPTDFDPDVPDCLVWINNKFYYVTYPNGSGAVTQFLGSSTPLAARGGFPTSFKLGSGADERQVAVFYTLTEQTVGGNKIVDVRLTIVSRDSALAWTVTDGPVDRFNIAGTPPVNVQTVGGNFDSDASTYELVLGTQGTEQAVAGQPGLLHMWSYGLDVSGVTQTAPIELPKVPAPTLNPGQTFDPWLMTEWQAPGQSLPGLAVVRELSNPRGFDVWSLSQETNGGFALSWSLVTDDLVDGSPAGFDVAGTNLQRIFAKDLDGSSGGIAGSDLLLVLTEDPNPNERLADVWLYAARGNGPSVWRRIIDDMKVSDASTLEEIVGEMDGGKWQLVDVNGDRLLDLVTCEAPFPNGLTQAERQFNYRASSLSGVAGKIGSVGSSAGATAFSSVLPGLLDANKDGYTDIISGSRLHLANLDGSYSQNVGGFAGGAQSRYQVERMWLGQPEDVLEVIVSDPASPTSSQNRIDRISGLGSETYTVVPLLNYDLGGEVQHMRALMAPDSATRQVKDLVAIVGNGAAGTLRRGIVDANLLTVTPATMWNGNARISAGMALMRRGDLPTVLDAPMNLVVQDVVVVDNDNPGRLVVCRSDSAYAPSFVDLPAGQQALKIAEGSASNDFREDVCVLTTEALAGGEVVYRLICVEQASTGGIATGATQHELARFVAPFSVSAVRSLQFDRSTRTLASGFLLLDDDGTGERSEVRLLRPIADQGGLAARIVLSPLNQSADLDVDVIVLDANQDGQIEVIGGDRSANDGLRRLQTNLAPSGN